MGGRTWLVVAVVMVALLSDVIDAQRAGFLDNADVDSGAVKAAFITYSTHPKVVFDLDDYSNKSEMVNAVYISEFEEGERNTADALGKVRSQILRQDRPDVPNVIVLIMTGASDRNSFRTLQESDALKPANFASGFDTVRTSLFTESRGDRAEVPNLIILITDANSNEDVGGTITAVEKAKGTVYLDDNN
ncbi:hypothetical protein DPMN_184267 [Dreissena polymorpha]|uniref:VWFA domain-containing protein n=1 Tax=Dreissena polymorpha TaxID=45954 RepID=A0A9D4I4E2_DREPO|nr:hypothetical protein DPMN_184267 [Dreissena polymorpha]